MFDLKSGEFNNQELPSKWYNCKWIGFALLALVLGNVLSKCGVIALGDMPQNH